jgi:hypothetical protein
MNPYSFIAKMNWLSNLWKQFGSLSSKEERENKTFTENRFPFMEEGDEFMEDDGLRWDQYGNPYISNSHFL